MSDAHALPPRMAAAGNDATAPLSDGWWRRIVRPAASRDELHAAFRLRYEVHVVESAKPYPEADHIGRELRDQLDDESTVLVAVRDGVVIGTHRSTPVGSARFTREYAEPFQLHLFAPADVRRMSFASRLVVHRVLRGNSRVAVALMIALFEYACEEGMTVCLCHAAPRVVPLFQRVGWRPHARPFFHSDSGSMQVPLVLLSDDIEHLERVGSPLASVARRSFGASRGRLAPPSGRFTEWT